jgi:histone deacetylase 1/2
MQEEYNSLLENQTWELVPLPLDRQLVICRWVYKTKNAANKLVSKHKARLVVKGFQQIHGIDYDENFAPVEKLDSIRLALAIGASKGWKFHQMDMNNAFLHGDLLEEILEQPPGFIHNSSLVCRLKKSLYGLKKAPRAWYTKIDSFFLLKNFVRCKSDPNVYMLKTTDPLLILFLYVDDLLIINKSV